MTVTGRVPPHLWAGRRLRHTGAMRSLAAACLLFLSACSSMPDEDEARGIYDSHLELIQEIENETVLAVTAFEAMPPFACAPREEEVADPTLQELTEAARCSAQESQWQQRRVRMRTENLEGLRDRVLWPLFERQGVKGIHVRVEFQDDRDGPGLVDLGGGHANKTGSTDPSAGAAVDGRALGWGLGQTSYSNANGRFGSGDYIKQIDLEWTASTPKAEVRFQVHLSPGFSPAQAWRDGYRTW